jgi:hypothetical protein
MSAVLLFNLLVMLRVLRVVATKAQEGNKTRSTLLGFLSLSFLLGVTWVLGALAAMDQNVTLQYAFAIVNSLQGLFLAYFYVYRDELVLAAFVDVVRCRDVSAEARKRHQSSSAAHRSQHSSRAQGTQSIPMDKSVSESPKDATLAQSKAMEDTTIGPEMALTDTFQLATSTTQFPNDVPVV